MPERFTQEALGHNSKVVNRADAKRALMKIPSLEDCEQRASMNATPAARVPPLSVTKMARQGAAVLVSYGHE